MTEQRGCWPSLAISVASWVAVLAVTKWLVWPQLEWLWVLSPIWFVALASAVIGALLALSAWRKSRRLP